MSFFFFFRKVVYGLLLVALPLKLIVCFFFPHILFSLNSVSLYTHIIWNKLPVSDVIVFCVLYCLDRINYEISVNQYFSVSKRNKGKSEKFLRILLDFKVQVCFKSKLLKLSLTSVNVGILSGT